MLAIHARGAVRGAAAAAAAYAVPIASLMVGYVAESDGDDGAAHRLRPDRLTSATAGVLRCGARHFDQFCVPPLTRGDDVGLAT